MNKAFAIAGRYLFFLIASGGGGNYKLYAGAGSDEYRFSGAFGHDAVVDSNGCGTLQIDDIPLTGGVQVGPNVRRSEDERFELVHDAVAIHFIAKFRRHKRAGARFNSQT